ncbi:hypothetical protein ASPWEDRAFT_42538 [Aspergillus wentii DTO 134E9]|uniref:Uncharacterized protein n=1 Tax=Aspergillus wentii DTO 134E9 TaxID=1073089 RepID=A0A1L9RHY6_ASPWE|nr:uncharacterized protein ASPWEDRAFT_42538 [Aspergillus wentii DTO 134E9]OJJ34546.1 hypothetical protein ASPWEDRAFT_42538 [Aspergillus wentii DTO 134E9]
MHYDRLVTNGLGWLGNQGLQLSESRQFGGILAEKRSILGIPGVDTDICHYRMGGIIQSTFVLL